MLTLNQTEADSSSAYSASVFARSASVSTAVVMNLPMWNPTLMNSGSLARDSSTHEYHHPSLSVRGMEKLPLREGPPMDPCPKDWGLDGEVLGQSVGFMLGEVHVELGLGAVWVEGGGASLAPTGAGG
jgi:hypothetical protein